jgi:serine/threonine protein kinase
VVRQSLGHYKIIRQVGSGGMGEVYAAEDRKLNRQVALKVLPEEIASQPGVWPGSSGRPRPWQPWITPTSYASRPCRIYEFSNRRR